MLLTNAPRDSIINEFAQVASKENLELGCKLIRKAVIDRALTKVSEDKVIKRAIDQRKAHAAGNPFRDESVIRGFQDLPPQLQPNPSGLTETQFQVYEDFNRLQ